MLQSAALPGPVVVGISHTTQAIGGVRDWFRCPTCQHARSWLAVVDGVLACRTCHGLAYASQALSTRNRRRRAAGARYERLKMSTIVDFLTPSAAERSAGQPRAQGDKPRGMHWNTYWRVLSEALRIDPDAASITIARYPRRWKRYQALAGIAHHAS